MKRQEGFAWLRWLRRTEIGLVGAFLGLGDFIDLIKFDKLKFN